MKLDLLMNNQKGSTLKIMFLSLIGFSLLVASTEFSQNMAFAAVKTNSTNMMITDTDANPLKGASIRCIASRFICRMIQVLQITAF